MIQVFYDPLDKEKRKWTLPNAAETIEWLLDVADRHSAKIENLSYILSDDEYVLYLNQKYLHHDYFTDILTFDYTDREAKRAPLVVDIYISVDRVRENSALYGNSNFIDELHRVMIHGLLHVIGFNDLTEAEETEMRKQEDIALALRMF